MGKWSELKAAEKARVIQFAIKNGVSDINTIRDTYNIYAEAEGGRMHIDLSKKDTLTSAVPVSRGRDMLTKVEVRGHRFEDGGDSSDLKLAKLNDRYDKMKANSQREWLQSWYDKRLPAINKEELKDYVTLGMQVPYYTPDSKQLGFTNYQLPDSVKGAYLPVFFGPEYTPTTVLNNPKLRSNWDRVPGVIYFNTVRGTTPIHEFTHATQYGGLGTYNPQFTNGKDIQETQSYLQQPDEQHARIMELRYINQLDPEKTDYTLEDVKKLYRFSAGKDVIKELNQGGMSDEDIMNALNTWASNSSKTSNPFDQGNEAHLAASGGKIHIASSKKGTFTAAASKHGKSVQTFASQVLAHKENYSPAMVKKANFARNFGGHKHAEGGSQEVFPWMGTKLTPPIIPDIKSMVYTIMSQRAGTDRALPDLVEAALHGNRKGNYSGSLNENGDPNFNRDLIGLYLYGNENGFEPIKREGQTKYKGSHDYTSYLRKHNINPKDVTSFKGDFIVGDSPRVSKEIYDIAKVLGQNKAHVYHNLDDDMLGNWNDILLNLDRGYSKEDLWYNMRPGYNIDDARNVKRHYELEGNKPVIQASKLWDFVPNKNMEPSEKIASYLLSRIGTPFILRDREELIPSNSTDLETKILNTSILEDALKSGVMIREGKDTYSPLYSLPEVTVVGTTDPYTIPRREKSYMRIVHPLLNKVPLVGHYVTQEDAGNYPYTDYKTTLDEVLSFATGGPLYPFSFKPVPVVRY